MKFISTFDQFLDETVNLNQTRVDDLETSITALKAVVNGSDWAPTITEWMPQGSWAHKTIIKPVDQGEFDADLIVFIEHVDGWSAADYINSLNTVFANNDVYKDMVRRWSHCVTITYANDKKIDIAPCVVNRLGYASLEVCNRNDNVFEQTEPKQYTQWLKDRNTLSGSHSFRKVTRLIKYLRDIKGTFTCSSVLLTTLLGYHIYPGDKGSATFSDTPTALKTLMARLDTWLQQNVVVPSVPNPYLPKENFGDVWTQEQYTNFRETMHRYRQWIDDAYDEADREESLEKWQRVFGEDFGKTSSSDKSAVSKQSGMDDIRRLVMSAVNLPFDVVAAIRRGGINALPKDFSRQPHMQEPEWPYATSGVGDVRIRAELHVSKTGYKIKDVSSTEVNQPKHWLRFTALNRNGLPLNSSEFEVQWRITNTDRAAFELGGVAAMRGGFYKGHDHNMRWEQLQYHGVHITEAFVILKRTREIVAKSEPFYVAVE